MLIQSCWYAHTSKIALVVLTIQYFHADTHSPGSSNHSNYRQWGTASRRITKTQQSEVYNHPQRIFLMLMFLFLQKLQQLYLYNNNNISAGAKTRLKQQDGRMLFN
jgi:hypothetical protein